MSQSLYSPNDHYCFYPLVVYSVGVKVSLAPQSHLLDHCMYISSLKSYISYPGLKYDSFSLVVDVLAAERSSSFFLRTKSRIRIKAG